MKTFALALLALFALPVLAGESVLSTDVPVLTGRVLPPTETEHFLMIVLKLTRYHELPPQKRPQIMVVPEEQFTQALCGKPCGLLGVRFWDQPDVVYVRDRADFFPGTIKAIIVHELTHWLQGQQGDDDLNDSERSCGRKAAREVEAYAAGYLYDYLYERREYNYAVPDIYDDCIFSSVPRHRAPR